MKPLLLVGLLILGGCTPVYYGVPYRSDGYVASGYDLYIPPLPALQEREPYCYTTTNTSNPGFPWSQTVCR